MALAFGVVAPAGAAPPADDNAAPAVQVTEHNSRSFRIPFNIDPEQKAEIKEIALIVSEDQGQKWTPVERAAPDARAIAFKATHDGEYWFAVQTVSKDGRLYPPNSATIEPKMRVNVDTTPPRLSLEALPRRGSAVSVRWEVRDERLDRNSFVLEYKADGDRDWRQVKVKPPVALIGERTWDPGTAGAIVVRASISDRAKNTKEATIELDEGSPKNPKLERGEQTALNEPPPLGSFASNTTNSLPQFPSDVSNDPAPRNTPTANNPPMDKGELNPNPFESAPQANAPEPPARSEAPNGGDPALRPQLVASPKFGLQYEVEDGGPSGPAVVELWMTLDGGRTWSRRAVDEDRKSPFNVDLGGDATYGLTLVARSASNLGDTPPAPGDRPQYTVEVDSTPPMVKLGQVRVGSGADAGKIQIVWQASDLHLAAKPIVISVRADGSNTWQPITRAIEITGRFTWTVPATAPPKFFVRVDAIDSVGNRNSDESPSNSPVMIDRARPKSRIIGLDPSARNASGSNSNQFR